MIKYVYCNEEIFHAFIREEEDNPNSRMRDIGWLDANLANVCALPHHIVKHQPEVKGENI